MTTMAGLTSRQLDVLIAASDEVVMDSLRDLGLVDSFGRLTIAGRATLPPLLAFALDDPDARALICEVEADDRRA